MKKLLLILMLGAGFVSVASATVDCSVSPSSNPCCDDVAYIQRTLEWKGSFLSGDGSFKVTSVSNQIDDVSPYCVDSGQYKPRAGGKVQNGVFRWDLGNASGTLQLNP